MPYPLPLHLQTRPHPRLHLHLRRHWRPSRKRRMLRLLRRSFHLRPTHPRPPLTERLNEILPLWLFLLTETALVEPCGGGVGEAAPEEVAYAGGVFGIAGVDVHAAEFVGEGEEEGAD